MYVGQALLPADGRESVSHETPSITAGLFFNFTLVKKEMKEKQLNDNS